uniref:Uncharacterized protein n=1 Tax=Rousettus aegyptiacus TaxID=9407 RepID=A0A7J8D6N8_ROUAE|nr:hypothetical protein HJG63_008750 [Rousettus aegyptiacus]
MFDTFLETLSNCLWLFQLPIIMRKIFLLLIQVGFCIQVIQAMVSPNPPCKGIMDTGHIYRSLLILLISSPLRAATEPQCDKCVEAIQIGGQVQQAFSSYTHQPAACYESATICTYAGRRYWMGWIKTKYVAGYICQGPRPGAAGKWACWTYYGQTGISDGGGVQDQARDQLVKETVQRVIEQTKPKPLKKTLGQDLDLPTLGKNLFVDLAERIAHAVGVTKCWVCGGALMGEDWPWKGTSLDAFYLLQWNHTVAQHEECRPRTWVLSSEVVGEECLTQIGPSYTQRVGETPCRRILL